jgi:Peptidase family M28
LCAAGRRCYHKSVLPHKNLFQAFAGIAVLFLALTSPALPPVPLPAVPSSVESITPGELRMHLEFLASDELGGRYTLSPNFAIAARYLATQLKSYGFHGAGNKGDFLQPFEVISSKVDPAKTSLVLTMDGKPATYSVGDFFATSGGGEADAQVVFVGSGISSPEQKHDDYAGLDVQKKIVLVIPVVPAGVDISKVPASEQGEGAAQSHGAIGIIRLPMRRFAEAMRNKDFKQRLAAIETVKLANEAEGRLPVITLLPDVAEKVVAHLGLKLQDIYDFQKNHTKVTPKVMDISAHITETFQQTRSATQNVVGVFKGTDPKLKDEYVVFSAHYDHLKTGPQGEIYHGADDDGSGTSAVLAIAHAISMNPPKRSVMVIFHAGEELGLLGSEYNTDYAPAVPLNKIMADLNIDMIGRSKPADDHNEADEHLTDARSVYLVGSNRISQELHKVSEQTNADYQKLKLDYYYNDPENPERIYFRSDHWNYAKHGIPVIFYFDGVHVDYHKPTDTVDKIDFTKLTEITRLVFETGWRLANLDHELDKKSN